MFRISTTKLVGLVAVTCAAAVAVPSAFARPTPDEPGNFNAAIVSAVSSEQVFVNGNNTIAYYPNGCKVGTIPVPIGEQTNFDYYGLICVTAPAITGSPAIIDSRPTGKRYGDACVGGDGNTYEYYGTEAAC
jgi:hypothetical protein